jgi:hypothetical protein
VDNGRVPHWYPTWQEALAAAAVLAVVGRVVRPRRATVGAFLWEAGILIGLFGAWQLTGRLAAHAPTGALGRGERLWSLERALHLPSEATVQQAVLPHHLVVQFFNAYYVYAHVNALLLTLAWLFLRHRERYAPARTAVALTTFACLVIQLVPVAPPRLLESGPSLGAHGIVDTATLYGQSVYGPVGQGLSDQFAAMPSVHVAWASAVALLVWRFGRGAWRYLGVAHLGLTVLVVITTGNHYWLDGVVAAGVLAVALVLRVVVAGLATRKRLPLPWQREALPIPVVLAGAIPQSAIPQAAIPQAGTSRAGSSQAARTGSPSSSVRRSHTGSGSSARSST